MSRMIDADVLIEIYEDRLEKLRTRYGDYSSEAGVCAGAIHLVREQPTIESERKWIPCSERLPLDHERYLLTQEIHYTTGRIIKRVCMAFYDDENDEWLEEQGEDCEIVSYPLAWMPLPEPAKFED